jgi:hypothetical protein
VTGSLYVADDDPIAAVVAHHEAHTADGYDYPAKTLAHVSIGGWTLVLPAEKAVELRDALAVGLTDHEQEGRPMTRREDRAVRVLRRAVRGRRLSLRQAATLDRLLAASPPLGRCRAGSPSPNTGRGSSVLQKA